MTCLYHPEPSATCMACVGHWHRPLADQLLRDGGTAVDLASALRSALAEIEFLERAHVAVTGEHADGAPCLECEVRALRIARNEDRTEWMTTYEAMRAEIEALTSQREAWREQAAENMRTAERIHAEREVLRCADLDEFHDGELSAERADAFRAHLADCKRCQNVLLGRMHESMVTAPARMP